MLEHAVSLPADIAHALRLIARELRDMPRDCAIDRAELLFWHGRLARRIDRIIATKTAAASSASFVAAMVSTIAASTPAIPMRATPAVARIVELLPSNRRWKARQVSPAFRRRVEAAGQLGLVLPEQ